MPAPSMDALTALVAADLQRVNEVIIEQVQSDITLISDVATYIISSGGKRLRPGLTLACAGLLGYEGERHIRLAACVEFIHTATLLHDDVVDESALRRGKPTANEVWSNQSSVLVGDFLFSRAFQLMVGDGSLDVLKLLSDTSATIAQGEVHQLMTTRDLATTEQDYLQVIESKTAALFAAAAQIGAMVSGKPEYEQELYQFGLNLGIAFQLMDDALDYSAKQDALGKTIGDDFREGKVTLPLILAFENADEKERAFVRQCFADGSETSDNLAEMMQIINHYDTIDATVKRAASYADKAERHLQRFTDNDHRKALQETLKFCICRAY